MCCTRWVCHHLCKTWKDGEERRRVRGCAGKIFALRCGAVARLRFGGFDGRNEAVGLFSGPGLRRA